MLTRGCFSTTFTHLYPRYTRPRAIAYTHRENGGEGTRKTGNEREGKREREKERERAGAAGGGGGNLIVVIFVRAVEEDTGVEAREGGVGALVGGVGLRRCCPVLACRISNSG